MKGGNFEQYRLILEGIETRNLKLKSKLLLFANKDFKSQKELDALYYETIGYLNACNDHWDIDEYNTEIALNAVSKICASKSKAYSFTFWQILGSSFFITALLLILFLIMKVYFPNPNNVVPFR